MNKKININNFFYKKNPSVKNLNNYKFNNSYLFKKININRY
jgi:hypothetical protein